MIRLGMKDLNTILIEKQKKQKKTKQKNPPALSSCKIDTHDCVTGEEISPSHLHSLL